ncbi:unnamed protein product [Thelazia callipaeda]|uniref:BED-type domain-containing protein n=1 Tax=Thelazia callipaeda TaxID=103827 RepID=A0A0N5CP98_THECL|nr:unnamed protein product [Thelazia callipaeda]
MLTVSSKTSSFGSNVLSKSEINEARRDIKHETDTDQIFGANSGKGSSATSAFVNNINELESDQTMINLAAISMEMLAEITTSKGSTSEVKNTKSPVKKARKQGAQKFKPSNVWNHFSRLLNGNVLCVHCGKVLKRKDSSTKTMWGHLRAVHFKGNNEIESVVSERAEASMILDDFSSTRTLTTQNLLEQQVGILYDIPSKNQQSVNIMNDITPIIWPIIPNASKTNLEIGEEQNLRNNIMSESEFNNVSDKKSLNFLSTIPHSVEVIKINSGSSSSDRNNPSYSPNEESKKMHGTDILHSNASATSATISNPSETFIFSNTNHLPTTHSMQRAADISAPFSIFDPESVALFMRTANDLNCTLSYHSRCSQPQLCLESNITAANKLKGLEVSITENNDVVYIKVQSDGIEIQKEMWKKTDKIQFMWAIRGKCQKVLTE